ncbi:MAG: type II secretion system GspH family protein [Campylobacteraceae bacterium]|jgi:hypothetical protein|nr:type II secretion system GspH family protein [Campylobacteraceae bacterium]
MTKAFTLVEVLIAVVIVFTAGLGLLSVSSNSSKLIKHAKAKNDANMLFSVAILNNLCDEKTDKNLYEAIKPKFTIKDDKLIAALKEQNLTCKSEEAFNMNLADSESVKGVIDNVPQTLFIINKITAAISGTNTFGYTIKAQM